MSEVIARLLAKFTLGSRIPGALIIGRIVVKSMTGSTHFSGATAAVAAASAGLDTLQALAATKGGATAARRQLAVCKGLFDILKGVVQQAADNDPANSATIIKSASMGIRKTRATLPKPDLAATWGPVSGSAKLVAKAYGRASYLWQISTDGVTFTTLLTTLKAKTAVQGLIVGQKYWFRLQVTTTNGARDWVESEPLLMK